MVSLEKGTDLPGSEAPLIFVPFMGWCFMTQLLVGVLSPKFQACRLLGSLHSADIITPRSRRLKSDSKHQLKVQMLRELMRSLLWTF